jgi:hypothetical protein
MTCTSSARVRPSGCSSSSSRVSDHQHRTLCDRIVVVQRCCLLQSSMMRCAFTALAGARFMTCTSSARVRPNGCSSSSRVSDTAQDVV